MNIGWPEIVLIVAVLLIFFGAKRLPELGRAIGRTVGELKRGLKEGEEEIKKIDEEVKKEEK